VTLAGQYIKLKKNNYFVARFWMRYQIGNRRGDRDSARYLALSNVNTHAKSPVLSMNLCPYTGRAKQFHEPQGR